MATELNSFLEKHNLPSLNDLESELGRLHIDDEDIILFLIKKLSDKVNVYIDFLSDRLQPDSDLISMQEANMFDGNERKEMFYLFKNIIYQDRVFMKINLDGTEEDKINYFREYFNNWSVLKLKLVPFVQKAINVWKLKDDDVKFEAYFG